MSTFEARCDRRTHAPRTLATIVLAIALAGGSVALTAVFGPIALEIAGLSIGYVWWALSTKWNAVYTPVHVRVRAGELRLDDETIAASEIRTGLVTHVDGSFVVRLSRRRLTAIEIVVSSLEEGRALLGALGKDASQSVVRFRAGSRMLVYSGGLFAAFVVLLPILAILSAMARSGAPLIVLVIVALVVFLWPSRVDVGPDGIRHAWLGWRTFIPSTRITSAARTSSTIVGLEVAYGASDPHRIFAAGQTRDALEERIREIAGQGAAADAPSVLARGGMPAREWIATLRTLTQPATYRSASIDIEAFWRVVESASASREDRAAAAVVVARDEATRTRLRVAIEAVANDDAETLEQALDDLREL